MEKIYELTDYHCPFCGAELEFVEFEGHDVGGDYWTPPSFEVDYYIYRCPECGEIIKNTKEL